MENKYYVPCIEEFRIGFECEFFNHMQDKVWKKEVCDMDLVSLAYDSYEHGTLEWEDDISQTFRVKYLNSSDIESCGFIKTKEYSDELIFQKNGGDYSFYELSYQFEDNKVCIEQWTQGSLVATVLPKEEWNSFNLFCGTIKNLSELKVLLKQIGVE